MSVNPLRDQPLCEIKVGSLRRPILQTSSGTKLYQICKNVRQGTNKVFKTSNPRILRLDTSLQNLARVMLAKHRSLLAHVNMTDEQWFNTPVFCTSLGTPLTQTNQIITAVSQEVTGLPFTCNDFRRGIISIARENRIDSAAIAMALLDPTMLADKHYLNMQNRAMDRFLDLLHGTENRHNDQRTHIKRNSGSDAIKGEHVTQVRLLQAKDESALDNNVLPLQPRPLNKGKASADFSNIAKITQVRSLKETKCANTHDNDVPPLQPRPLNKRKASSIAIATMFRRGH